MTAVVSRGYDAAVSKTPEASAPLSPLHQRLKAVEDVWLPSIGMSVVQWCARSKEIDPKNGLSRQGLRQSYIKGSRMAQARVVSLARAAGVDESWLLAGPGLVPRGAEEAPTVTELVRLLAAANEENARYRARIAELEKALREVDPSGLSSQANMMANIRAGSGVSPEVPSQSRHIAETTSPPEPRVRRKQVEGTNGPQKYRPGSRKRNP